MTVYGVLQAHVVLLTCIYPNCLNSLLLPCVWMLKQRICYNAWIKKKDDGPYLAWVQLQGVHNMPCAERACEISHTFQPQTPRLLAECMNFHFALTEGSVTAASCVDVGLKGSCCAIICLPGGEVGHLAVKRHLFSVYPSTPQATPHGCLERR